MSTNLRPGLDDGEEVGAEEGVQLLLPGVGGLAELLEEALPVRHRQAHAVPLATPLRLLGAQLPVQPQVCREGGVREGTRPVFRSPIVSNASVGPVVRRIGRRTV